jgi:hypothetical protein
MKHLHVDVDVHKLWIFLYFAWQFDMHILFSKRIFLYFAWKFDMHILLQTKERKIENVLVQHDNTVCHLPTAVRT